MISKVYVVTAEHPEIAGKLTAVRATLLGANQQAADFTNAISDRMPDGCATANATDWEDVLAVIQDYHGAQYCYVEIVEAEVQS